MELEVTVENACEVLLLNCVDNAIFVLFFRSADRVLSVQPESVRLTPDEDKGSYTRDGFCFVRAARSDVGELL